MAWLDPGGNPIGRKLSVVLNITLLSGGHHDERRLFCSNGLNGLVSLVNALHASVTRRIEHCLTHQIPVQPRQLVLSLIEDTLINLKTTSLLVSGSLLLGATAAQAGLPDEATMYKNPQSGCCTDDAELGEIKQRAGVPHGLGSCHTIGIGEYWIEGHVPMEAITKLFEDQPDRHWLGRYADWYAGHAWATAGALRGL